jgi:predicted membrane protein
MQVYNDPRKKLRSKINIIATAFVFIAAGVLIILKNLGMLDYSIYRIFLSWQMILIVIGAVSIVKRDHTGGWILIGIGLFFLIPSITGTGYIWLHTYWPLIFVFIGVVILAKLLRPEYRGKENVSSFSSKEYSSTSDNGFVNSTNTFGSVKQIVLDPVFRGAKLSNTFGGTILDLRHTSLQDEITYIDIECTFGGIEIYLPSNWMVENKLQHLAGGSDDKRFQYSQNFDNSHKLVLRGSVTFGGVEIKS